MHVVVADGAITHLCFSFFLTEQDTLTVWLCYRDQCKLPSDSWCSMTKSKERWIIWTLNRNMDMVLFASAERHLQKKSSLFFFNWFFLTNYKTQFRSVQSLSQVWLFETPMDCSTLGFPIHHQLPEFTQTHVHRVGDAIQTSYPLSSPSPPTFNLSQHQGLFQWVSSSQVAKVLELQLQLQHQSFQWIFRTDFL